MRESMWRRRQQHTLPSFLRYLNIYKIIKATLLMMNRSCCCCSDSDNDATTLCRIDTNLSRAHYSNNVRVWWSARHVDGIDVDMIRSTIHRKWICKFGTNSVSVESVRATIEHENARCLWIGRISFVQHLIYIHINLNFMLMFHVRRAYIIIF